MSTASSDPHPIHQDGPVLTAVGHATAVVVGGLVLLNVAFGLYAAWFLLVHSAIGAIAPESAAGGLVGDLVAIGAWLVAVRWVSAWALRRHPARLGTAVWLVVPTASVLLPVGVALAGYPAAATLGICGVAVVGVLWLMRRAGMPWEQLLAVAWVSVALGAMLVLGVEI